MRIRNTKKQDKNQLVSKQNSKLKIQIENSYCHMRKRKQTERGKFENKTNNETGNFQKKTSNNKPD